VLKDIKESDLRRLLQIENLNETGTMALEWVVDNADKYHSDKD